MPARPDDTDSTPDKQVDWHLLRRVYGSEAVSCLFTMLVATVLATVVAVYAPGGRLPFVWWLVMAAAVLLRLVTARQFRSRATRDTATEWQRRHVRNVTLTGLVWGIGGAAMLHFAPAPQIQTAILVVIAAMTAAAVAYQGAVLRGYQGYLLGAVLPVAVVLLASPSSGSPGIAVLSLIYCGAMWSVATLYHRDVHATTRMGYEMQHLSQQLEEANRKLETDIDARLRAENLLGAERDVLENVARNMPLLTILDELNLDIEALFPGSLCSVVILGHDDRRIEECSAPSLPEAYVKQLIDLPIGPEAGSCGTAMHRREQVIVENIADDPLWEEYREMALAHDLHACWSTPIVSRSGAVLGSFAIYRRAPRTPSKQELETVSRMSRLMALIIEDVRNSERIQLSEQRFRDFAGAAADWFWEMDPSLQYSYVSEKTGEANAGPEPPVLEKTRERLCEATAGDASTAGNSDARQAVELEFTVDLPNCPEMEVLTLVKPVYDTRHELAGWRGVGRDVTRERQMEREIRHQATHDSLTGLVNRREFDRRLRELLAADSQPRECFVAFIDLDRFKLINDTAGHSAGDAALKRIAEILRDGLPGDAVAGRLGGDEFGISFSAKNIHSAIGLMECLVSALAGARFDWDNSRFSVGASIGLVPVTKSYKTSDQVLSDADASCYRAKNGGGNRVCVYQPDLDPFTEDTRSTGELTRALKDDRALVHIQKVCALRVPDRTPWYEVLLRYSDGSEAVSPPSRLIAAAERYGQMGVVDVWVLEQALDRWGSMLTDDALRLSINLSATSIEQKEIANRIARLVEQARIAPGALCFELTETSTLTRIEHAAGFMTELRRLGCGLVIDNFGGGRSSFSFLKQLPGDYLAIDGGYVRTMTMEPANHAIVEAIHKIGQAHGMQTLAKCVESRDTLDALRAIGVDFAQGHHLGGALPAAGLDPAREPEPDAVHGHPEDRVRCSGQRC
ncbi:MAG: EAL domain-containing protein [Gammaproteobacteria bacterium]|nr:EAL domain-containing protein [Gammaproteobacteria bacterium]